MAARPRVAQGPHGGAARWRAATRVRHRARRNRARPHHRDRHGTVGIEPPARRPRPWGPRRQRMICARSLRLASAGTLPVGPAAQSRQRHRPGRRIARRAALLLGPGGEHAGTIGSAPPASANGSARRLRPVLPGGLQLVRKRAARSGHLPRIEGILEAREGIRMVMQVHLHAAEHRSAARHGPEAAGPRQSLPPARGKYMPRPSALEVQGQGATRPVAGSRRPDSTRPIALANRRGCRVRARRSRWRHGRPGTHPAGPGPGHGKEKQRNRSEETMEERMHRGTPRNRHAKQQTCAFHGFGRTYGAVQKNHLRRQGRPPRLWEAAVRPSRPLPFLDVPP